MPLEIPQDHDYPTELRIYKTGNLLDSRADADLIIPGEDLTNSGSSTIDISQRIQNWKDTAEIAIRSHSRATGESYLGEITSGDRVEFWVGNEHGLSNEDSPSVRRWTGFVRSPTYTAERGQRVLISFSATDWVFETLSNRIVYDAFVDTPITGSEDAIVETLLDEHAPQIDQSRIADVDVTTDREIEGRDLLEVFADLAETADAIMSSEGRSLIYEPLGDIPIQFDDDPLSWADIGLSTHVENDTDLVNDWRIDGGTGSDVDEETLSSGGTPVAYRTITEDDPLVYQLDPEKNRLDTVSIWTRDMGTGENVRARIQASSSDDSGPRDTLDTTKDIVSDNSGAVISADGFRPNFRLKGDEALPDDPWLIIDTGGPDGQEIGLASTDPDVPAIITYYPFPVNIRVADEDSVDTYALRRDRKKTDAVTTFDAAFDVGSGLLRHSAQPHHIVATTARTPRTHALDPGDVVAVDLPEILATGDHLVIERSESFDAATNRLTTDLTLQSIDTV